MVLQHADRQQHRHAALRRVLDLRRAHLVQLPRPRAVGAPARLRLRVASLELVRGRRLLAGASEDFGGERRGPRVDECRAELFRRVFRALARVDVAAVGVLRLAEPRQVIAAGGQLGEVHSVREEAEDRRGLVEVTGSSVLPACAVSTWIEGARGCSAGGSSPQKWGRLAFGTSRERLAATSFMHSASCPYSPWWWQTQKMLYQPIFTRPSTTACACGRNSRYPSSRLPISGAPTASTPGP